MQFLRYASPSNAATHHMIKPQTPDGYVTSPKQPPRITRKPVNLSSRKSHNCHSCLSSLHRIFNNLAQKCSFICSQMGNLSELDPATEELMKTARKVKTNCHIQPLSVTFHTGFRATNSAPQLEAHLRPTQKNSFHNIMTTLSR